MPAAKMNASHLLFCCLMRHTEKPENSRCIFQRQKNVRNQLEKCWIVHKKYENMKNSVLIGWQYQNRVFLFHIFEKVQEDLTNEEE